MGLPFLDQPFALTLVYGVLGTAFIPFLGGTLLILLNRKRFGSDGRSGWLSNVLLTAAASLLLVLLANDLIGRLT